uniref:Uncharacterized protein n=1 Tax=Oryza rufipogon TaxID=4529 RepID=A0A0E0MXV4_ORYRU
MKETLNAVYEQGHNGKAIRFSNLFFKNKMSFRKHVGKFKEQEITKTVKLNGTKPDHPPG